MHSYETRDKENVMLLWENVHFVMLCIFVWHLDVSGGKSLAYVNGIWNYTGFAQ